MARLFSIISSVFLAASLWGQTPLPGTAETLQAAISKGRVLATFHGTGTSSGDSIIVTLVKSRVSVPGALELTIPPGSFLRSADASSQSMVVMEVRGRVVGDGVYSPSENIVLLGETPDRYVLSAYCIDFEKDNPADGATFSLEPADRVLACIARQSRNATMAARQAAVWIYTEHLNFDAINQKFTIDTDEWAAAQTIARQCGAIR